MFKRFFSILVSHKNAIWLEVSSWIGWALFLTAILYYFSGNAEKAVGFTLLLSSPFAGIILGKHMALIITAYILKASDRFRDKFSAALQTFGFIAFPAVVGNWTNSHLQTDIEMDRVEIFFIGAFICAVISFNINPDRSED